MSQDTTSGWGAIMIAVALAIVLIDLGVTSWKIVVSVPLVMFGIVMVKVGE